MSKKSKGEEGQKHNIILNCMKAGQEKYKKEKNRAYERLKDRKQ